MLPRSAVSRGTSTNMARRTERTSRCSSPARPDQQRRRASPVWLLTKGERKPPSADRAVDRRLLDCTRSSDLAGRGVAWMHYACSSHLGVATASHHKEPSRPPDCDCCSWPALAPDRVSASNPPRPPIADFRQRFSSLERPAFAGPRDSVRARRVPRVTIIERRLPSPQSPRLLEAAHLNG